MRRGSDNIWMIIITGTIYCAITLYQVLLYVNFFNHLGLLDGSVGKKNLPAMQETQETRVRSLGLEDSLEEENGNPLQYSYLKNPMDRGIWWGCSPKACKELDTTEHHYKITEIFQLVKTKESRVIVSIKECRFVIWIVSGTNMGGGRKVKTWKTRVGRNKRNHC